MSTSPEHFILFRDLPLMYGRVPKVANSSIKVALCKLLSSRPEEGLRKSTDRFWRENTHGETTLVTPTQARELDLRHFSFSFVRNPFDRLVAAYNNKLIEIQEVPQPMQRMGLFHGMAFEQFIACLCSIEPELMDNHVRPQADLLFCDDNLVPKFVGRIEHMRSHWKLRRRMTSKASQQSGVCRARTCGVATEVTFKACFQHSRHRSSDVRLREDRSFIAIIRWSSCLKAMRCHQVAPCNRDKARRRYRRD